MIMEKPFDTSLSNSCLKLLHCLLYSNTLRETAPPVRKECNHTPLPSFKDRIKTKIQSDSLSGSEALEPVREAAAVEDERRLRLHEPLEHQLLQASFGRLGGQLHAGLLLHGHTAAASWASR